jgi:hypothetical protein
VAILNRAIRNARAMMRAAEWGDSSIPPNSAAGPGAELGIRGAGGGEGGALAIGTVLACVKALYDDTTVLPFKAYQGDRNGPHAPIGAQPRIVVEPFGPDLMPSAGFGQLVVSKAMRGRAFAYVVNVDPVTRVPGPADRAAPGLGEGAPSQEAGKYFGSAGRSSARTRSCTSRG